MLARLVKFVCLIMVAMTSGSVRTEHLHLRAVRILHEHRRKRRLYLRAFVACKDCLASNFY